MDRAACLALDAVDELAAWREKFLLPEDTIYLDGNSLGALPAAVPGELAGLLTQEWGRDLISGWNRHGWIDLPRVVGEKIAPLLGAAPGQVIAADSTSVNLFKLLSAGLSLVPGRTDIVSVEDNFPTDLYMAQGLSELLGTHRCRLRLTTADKLAAAIDEQTAVVLLTHVDFRSGRLFDLSAVTRQAHDAGAVTLWDLAHSAGALPLDLDAASVDLAVGCGYKYLNGGPGAPAFMYVAQRHQAALRQPLTGWMGHRAPFEFATRFDPAPGMDGLLCGTPAVLAMRALSVALDVWNGVSLTAVREKSIALTELFRHLVEAAPELAELRLASPVDPGQRGSQIAYAHPEGFAIMQALIDAGVTGDFREPDLLRFGVTPLYTRFVDVWDAVERLGSVLGERRYDQPRYRQRQRVT